MDAYREEDYNKGFDLKLWQGVFNYIKPYKKELFTLALLMVGVAGADVIFPLMNKYAIDNFVVVGDLEGLIGFSWAYFGLVVFLATTVFLFIEKAGEIQTKISYDIRKNGFEHLQKLSFSYYDKKAVGWLMARMTSDVKKLGDTIAWGLVDMVWGSAMMVGIMGVMLYLNWKLALITLIVIPPLVLISLFFQKKILKAHRGVRKVNSQITGAFNEGIMGVQTTKTLVREEENLREFQGVTSKMRGQSVRAAIFSSLYLPIVLTLGSIGTGLALWFGGEGVMLEVIGYGTLVAFLSYTVQFFEPLRELARIFAELQSAQASAERVLSMINTDPEIKDSQEVIEVYGNILNPKYQNWPKLQGNISFKDVSFSYNDEEKILQEFNLEVKAAETIALVGETGSGKSTIINLLCRFYEPIKGEVLIDGVDYRQRSQLWLHQNLGYVLQSPYLFSGTIKENIRYGNLKASDLDIIEAAKMVNAHSFITKLEKGYDTQVGEGGGNLSTGEKQLISFARAILAKPRIFVLDEATSSIDTQMERVIQRAIDELIKDRTSFIVAHRLSTIRSADRILVIKDGKIKEAGSHKELLVKQGYYYNLYRKQFNEI
ncbi:ABC transporter ATP-binding protein [Halonatronum saccharophilum]|uniref:ABC transporter ATP-binding protein n=1 Tax=Halonatronum saccharophilum TaxID=150060 RepID=UPI000487FC77|nr:ABC transporter ATP-binding protein [Halonatronum saccharophilum]